MQSWLGTSVLTVWEWFIKKMPLVSYIYAASKQISTAISPGIYIYMYVNYHIYIVALSELLDSET